MDKMCLVGKRLGLLVLFGTMIPFITWGQSYNTALGIRWGDGIGISARQRLLKKTSLEGIFYQHQKTDQTIAGIMLDHHMPVLTRRLNLFAGGGVGRTSFRTEDNVNVSHNAVLINAGLEFTLARLNLSWDIVPVVPLSNQETSLTTLTAFSLRYVLVKKSRKGLFEKDHKNKRKHKHKRRSNRKK